MSDRRDFLKTGAVALGASLLPGRALGASDRIRASFIGMGRMGTDNLRYAMKQPNVEVVHVCDVYQPHLDRAVSISSAKGEADFRRILDDKSVDVVCISTPDHWHAYMTVEACKAGKDVYVEKPICVAVSEGRKMVQAARRYNRVVQAGTMQRSGDHFQKACELVRGGGIGKVTFVRTWNYGNMEPRGIGTPPDSDPPAGLNWDMWLGPAPKRPFNANRFGVDPNAFSHFRWFWDYAGGMMTDWGIHLLDIVQMAFNEAAPTAVTALGGKYFIQDNRETPDTLQVTYEYPGFIVTYENRLGNAQSMFKQGYGILFHGEQATMFVDRTCYRVFPEKSKDPAPIEVKSANQSNMAHWADFLECVRTRRKPVSDIEIGHKSTATALLGNVALRSRRRVDWDAGHETTEQAEARQYLRREHRAPWKLEI